MHGGRVHITGKKLRELNEKIFERDGCSCVVCGRWVDPNMKFHHEPCGSNKSDEIEKGVVLCEVCHYGRHFGKNAGEIRKKVEAYLTGLYPP